VIQENAIRSWLSLRPKPNIILFGSPADIGDAVLGLDVAVVTEIKTNAYGTPLVSDMFRQADARATTDVVAFVNADIILTQSTLEAAHIASSWSLRFLVVAQRHDVDVRERLEFDSGWEQRWARPAVASGRLHSAGGIDLFMYPRGQYGDMPPFAVGRSAYDNWMLWHTVAKGIPLIDGTAFVTLIHQNHDYGHATVDVWDGVEARANRKWIKHWWNYYTITHATWTIDAAGGMARATALKYRLARPRQVLSRVWSAYHRYRSRLRSWRSRPAGP
jgi:hypothetical protein